LLALGTPVEEGDRAAGAALSGHFTWDCAGGLLGPPVFIIFNLQR
jgi:hypothetical protein